MREIKFRAWHTRKPFLDEEHEKMCEMVYFGITDLDGDYIITSDTNIEDYTVIEQFTGLKDINGKDIYEGDIVKGVVKFAQLLDWHNDKNCNFKMCGVVYWDRAGFRLKVVQSMSDKGRTGLVNYFDFTGRDCEIFDNMEVIGNKWENGDLLK